MTTTTFLELEDQATGANDNTWGDVADANFAILELAIARVLGINTTGGTTTLTSAQNRYPIINVTGVLVSNAIIAVKTQEKNFTVINNTTGAFSVTVKTAAGTGKTVPRGRAIKVYCDGTNVLLARHQGIPSAQAGGTVDAITATFEPAFIAAEIQDGTAVLVEAAGANTSTTPTFNPDTIGAATIKKNGAQALAAGDIPRIGYKMLLVKDDSGGHWELLNPNITSVLAASETVPGIVELATNAETVTGTDTTRATHPAGVAAAIAASSPAYPPGHIFGLTMSNAADTANDITVAAGSARDEANTGNLVLAASITKRIDATWAVGDAQGGLNTGTVANDTWYEVHLIKRVDTGVVDVMFTTTANRATLPTNYTLQRRIGWVRYGTATLLQFTQIADHFTWTTQVNDVSASNTTTATAVTLTAPPGSLARFRATLNANTGGAVGDESVIVFSEIVEGNITPATSTGKASLAAIEPASGVSGKAAGHYELRVSSTSTIEHDGNTSGGDFDISTFGFIDSRGRFA